MQYVKPVSEPLTRQKITILPWIIWFLGAFFYFYENLIQVSPGVMVQNLMSELTLDAAQLGILAGVYFYTYALIQIPAGVMADNINVRNLLLSAITFCVLGCILFASSQGMVQAAVGRLLIGLGSGFAAICSMKLATFWFPANRFPLLVGFMITLGMTGSIVGGGPLAMLVDKIGWRDTSYFLAFVGVILIGFVFQLVQESNDATEKKLKHASHDKSAFQGLIKVLTCKQSWFLAAYGGLMFAPTSIFGGLWGVPYLISAYDLSKPYAASLVSFLFLGWVIGGPLSGVIAGKIQKKRPLLSVGAFGALACMCTILYVQKLPMPLLSLLIVLFGLFSSCFLPSFSIIKEMHGKENAGSALGFMNTANMIGGAIGLPLVGMLLNCCWDGTMVNHIKHYATMDYVLSLSILPGMLLTSLILSGLIKEEQELSKRAISLKCC